MFLQLRKGNGIVLLSESSEVPQTEFEIEFKEIGEMLTTLEKSDKTCPSNCSETNETECKCVYLPSKGCTNYQYIEEGLKTLNLHCVFSNALAVRICQVLERLKDIVKDETTMCVEPMAPQDFLRRIKIEHQKYQSAKK
ncbi:hypothetical protein MHYP_G00106590 [Metynnis hypsauchen]